MLTAETLTGNWGTLLLPINKDNSIDFKRLDEEIELLNQSGVDGIYSNGTAGEFHNQTEDEFDNVNALLAEKCHPHQKPFQIGASHPSPIISLERIKRSLYLKPDAFQVIFPDWVSTNKNERFVFLEKLIDASGGVPLVLYNPPHAKTVLMPADFAELSSAFPQLIGLKVAASGKDWYEQMRRYATGISVFLPGHWLATGVREGVAAGSYSNIACLSPSGAQWWWHLMQANLEEALEVEKRIHLFFEQCIQPFVKKSFSNPALDKFLAAVGGWAPIGTRIRWPYDWIAESEVDSVKKKARQLLPEFFYEHRHKDYHQN